MSLPSHDISDRGSASIQHSATRLIVTLPGPSGPNCVLCSKVMYSACAGEELLRDAAHFFLPPAAASSFRSQVTTLPSITTPLPSMKATRERPSQFLNVSQTSGCCGWKEHCAISLDFSECGSSIFFPPVSFPIFHLSLEIRQADRPQRTKPIGEYP